MKKSLQWMLLMAAAIMVWGAVMTAQEPGPDEGGPIDPPEMQEAAPLDVPEAMSEEGPEAGPMKPQFPFMNDEGNIEIEKVVQFLNEMDSDSDGLISREERQAFLKEKGIAPPPAPMGRFPAQFKGNRGFNGKRHPRFPKEFSAGGPKAGQKFCPNGGPKCGHQKKAQDHLGFWREGEAPDRGHFKMNPPCWNGHKGACHKGNCHKGNCHKGNCHKGACHKGNCHKKCPCCHQCFPVMKPGMLSPWGDWKNGPNKDWAKPGLWGDWKNGANKDWVKYGPWGDWKNGPMNHPKNHKPHFNKDSAEEAPVEEPAAEEAPAEETPGN